MKNIDIPTDHKMTPELLSQLDELHASVCAMEAGAAEQWAGIFSTIWPGSDLQYVTQNWPRIARYIRGES